MSGEHAIKVHGAEHAEHHDPVGNKIGMWLFLFTELILFGGLFIAFAVYLHLYRWDFRAGSGSLDKILGAVNTMILLTSSLTMALAIAALTRKKMKASLGFMAGTILLALMFLGVKAVEWGHKFHIDLVPGSTVMQNKPMGQQVFYALYYTMTGVHALHVIIGIGAIAVAAGFVKSGRCHAERPDLLENVGLYWHLVDVIWIFLFPLFYLIG